MITVTREQKSGLTSIRISGTIDEQVDLQTEIGALPARVNIICRDVTGLNSSGVKSWIEFFGKAAAARIQFTFSECPPSIVEQLNYISNFGCGGKVISVSVPFTCSQCRNEARGTVKTEDLKSVAYQLPPVKCPQCGAPSSFEDSPEEYFGFLIRHNA
jgi:hypothetical protein